MTISWIEKLFHGFKPEHRSMSPERDVVPRSVLITPPKSRTISTPITTPRRTTPSAPVAPVAPARRPEPGPDFSDSGFGLVSPLYQPSMRHETVVRNGFGDFGGGGAESSWSSGCGSSGDSSGCSSGD